MFHSSVHVSEAVLLGVLGIIAGFVAGRFVHHRRLKAVQAQCLEIVNETQESAEKAVAEAEMFAHETAEEAKAKAGVTVDLILDLFISRGSSLQEWSQRSANEFWASASRREEPVHYNGSSYLVTKIGGGEDEGDEFSERDI